MSMKVPLVQFSVAGHTSRMPKNRQNQECKGRQRCRDNTYEKGVYVAKRICYRAGEEARPGNQGYRGGMKRRRGKRVGVPAAGERAEGAVRRQESALEEGKP